MGNQDRTGVDIVGGDLNSAILAAAILGRRVDVARSGELGACVACGGTVESHFSSDDGRWLGCERASSATVFVLVPVIPTGKGARVALQALAGTPAREVKGHSSGTRKEARVTSHDRTSPVRTATAKQTPQPAVVARGFVRARYQSTLHHKAKVDNLPLSPTRAKVLRAIHREGRDGILAKQIMTRARLPHGSVQQTLNWLRNHKLVQAVEDTE